MQCFASVKQTTTNMRSRSSTAPGENNVLYKSLHATPLQTPHTAHTTLFRNLTLGLQIRASNHKPHIPEHTPHTTNHLPQNQR